MLGEPIKVEGLAALTRSLKKLDADLPKAVRQVNNDAVTVVVKYALPLIPVRTGRARASVKARSTRVEGRVRGGNTKAPYYPWLDFGGHVGKKRSVSRPFYTDGRYLYMAYYSHKKEVYDFLVKALKDLCESAGLEVT